VNVTNGRATAIRREPFAVPGLSSFGEDSRGNLYLMSATTGSVFRARGLTGGSCKVVPYRRHRRRSKPAG
jgi:hypothetical protein